MISFYSLPPPLEAFFPIKRWGGGISVISQYLVFSVKPEELSSKSAKKEGEELVGGGEIKVISSVSVYLHVQ